MRSRGWSSRDGISALIRGDAREPASSSSPHTWAPRRSREQHEGSQPSASQEDSVPAKDGIYQNPQPPELLWKPPSLWYFVTAARTEGDTGEMNE